MAVVAQAARAGRRVRVGRRPQGNWVTIDLSGYRRVLRIDRDNGSATVEAGISLRSLGITLGSWGLSLENGSRDAAQSLGAAVSLGAHGCGPSLGGLVTEVEALRMVVPDGTVIDCSADREAAIFTAARAGLGALGVIATVTLRAQRGFNLRVARSTVDLDRALADLEQAAEANDYFELSWLSGRSTARVTTANRTTEAPDGREVDRGYRWLNRGLLRRPKIEFAFPRGLSGPALRRARAVRACGRMTPPFPIVVSMTAGDDVPLSPAEGRPTLFIAGVDGLDGRPQWSATGRSAESLRAWYPRFAEWEAVRDHLDPDRRFAYTSGQG